MNDHEHSVRRQLAAAYRLLALAGLDDHIATHLSARLDEETYLINPFGVLFDEITASNLVRVDMSGTVLDDDSRPVNPAGINIHGGLLGAITAP